MEMGLERRCKRKSVKNGGSVRWRAMVGGG